MENHNPELLKFKVKLPKSSLPKQVALPPNPKQEEDIEEELEEGDFEPKQEQDDTSKVEEEEIFETGPKKRVCYVCYKEFKDGKALGGHLRIHNKLKGSKKAVAPNSLNSRPGLDVGGPFKCPEFDCHKTFKSEKCLHGHMRSHPERPYRGMLRPLDEGSSSSGFDHQDEAMAVAELRMLGVADFIGHVNKSIPREERLKMIQRGEFDEDEKYFLQDYLGISIPPSPSPPHLNLSLNQVVATMAADGKWPCHTCGKVFLTHQALGGHMSTHNKNKEKVSQVVDRGSGLTYVRSSNSSDNESENNTKMIYTCPVCYEEFQTVDKLVEHLTRWHCASTSSSDSSSAESSSPPTRRELLFDLNHFPMEE